MRKTYTRELDERDHQIIRLLAEGKRATGIGKALGISPRTVEHHTDQIKDHLKAKTLAHLIHIAHLNNFL